LLLAFLPAITELFSWRGSDNFFLPIFTVGWMALVLRMPHTNSWTWILAAFLLLSMLGWLVLSKQWLDQSGWWAALWVAAVLWMSGGWKALLAPVFLLVAGSVAGRLFRSGHASEKRTAQQVFSNGWIGVVLYMLYGITGQEYWQVLAWCSFAISVCDTVSSEVGTAVRGKTYNIANFRAMEPGLSGGISLAGTLGGLIAVLLLAVCLKLAFSAAITHLIWVVGTGMAGMLVDSVMGSKWQALWRQGSGFTETSGSDAEAQLVKGVAWLDNHWVNFLSNGITMAGAAAIYWFWVLRCS
jgi:uncharacterized protein (TIGR00297 family)